MLHEYRENYQNIITNIPLDIPTGQRLIIMIESKYKLLLFDQITLALHNICSIITSNKYRINNKNTDILL